MKRLVLLRRMKTVIVVRASDLAAVCGKHPYRDQDDAVREVIARVRGGNRKANEVRAANVLKNVSDDVKAESAKVLGLKVQDTPQLSVDLVTAIQKRAILSSSSTSSNPLPVSLPEQMKPVVEQQLRMAVGTVEETSILELATRTACINPEASAPSSQVQIVDLAVTASGNVVRVVGVCDALDRACVYEIKRRKSKLFHTIPTYERIQLESYLRMYDKMDGALVEYYPEEGFDVHWVERDDSIWEELEMQVVEAFEARGY